MRVLFVATAGAHLPWITPLSWACQVAGHEVLVASRPAATGFLTAAGLTVAPVGDEDAIRTAQSAHRGLASTGGPRHLASGWVSNPGRLDREARRLLGTRQITSADAMTDDLVALARAWRPDVVVYDTVALAGLVTAAAVKVPAFGHTWGFSFGFDFERDEDLRGPFARLFERFGVEPRFAPEAWIDPCPQTLRSPHPVPWAPMRLVPYNGPLVLPEWLLDRPERPRVCVTGGVTTTALTGLVGRLAEGVRRAGAEAVVTVAGHHDVSAADLPDGVRLLSAFPMSTLLPTCDAVVHHGGVGTGMISAVTGLPQLVVPHTAIQDHWAERITEVGAGLTLDVPDGPDVDAVAEAVTALLTVPGHRESAARLRDENAAMPAPARLVGLLERAVAEGGVVGSELVVRP
ncbi:nucleotide disphospho-sugar-binding domain-containing protein [Kitasatospora sp. NPDC097691]|uniref:nucleotide disphospho-sugar-binding domain-containing protein n=1 Tax=Kitasatospora sp. NPDC097691 TaxID=3157231 RepID=UPI00332B6242